MNKASINNRIKNLLSPKPDMGKGPVNPIIITLAIPAMLSMFFQNLYALIDTMFISWLGPVSLGAQSIAIPLFYVALCLVKGVQIGASSLMSNYLGKKEHKKANKLSQSALPLMLLVLSPMLLLSIPQFINVFFSALGASQEMMPELYNYVPWLVLGFPVLGYMFLCEAIFMSRGDTITPMKGILLGVITNLILDPILMFYLGLGIAGASIATLIGYLVSSIYLYRKLNDQKLERPSLSIDKNIMFNWKQIASLGIFISIAQLISPISLILVNGILASFGAVALGAWNIMSRLEMMGTLPLYGMSLAIIPFIAYNMGASEYERVRSGLRFFLLSSSIIILPVMALYIFIPEFVVLPFRASEEAMALGAYAIRISAFAQILIVFELALMACALAFKRPLYSLSSVVFRLLLVRVPMAWFLSAWGVQEVFWAQPISIIAGSIFSAFLLWHLLKTNLPVK